MFLNGFSIGNVLGTFEVAYRVVENFGELLYNSPKFNPPKVYYNIQAVSQITYVIKNLYWYIEVL